MKTWQAALAHLALANLQAISAVGFFSPDTFGGVLANTQIAISAQTALMALQGWVAKKNSNTAPNGKQLVQTIDDNFVSQK